MEPIATVPAYDMVFVRGGKYVMGQEHPDWEDLASHHKQELREEFVADFLIGMLRYAYPDLSLLLENIFKEKKKCSLPSQYYQVSVTNLVSVFFSCVFSHPPT
jgi:hypothetical protein